MPKWRKWDGGGGGLVYPDQGPVHPGPVTFAVFDMDPVVLDFKDFHGKVFIDGAPRHLGEFGSRSLAHISFIVFDDRASVGAGHQLSVDPVDVAVQVLNPMPVPLFA